MKMFSTNRDKVMAGVTLLALVLTYVFYDMAWSPKAEELDATQARVDTLLVSNQRAKSELAQGKTAELRAEADRYALDLDVMRRLVPTGNEVPALLEQVSTAARRVGLDISDVQPEPQLAGDQYDAYKYRLSVRGAYHQIGDLLANIGSLQRIVAPINLTLAPVGGTDPRKLRARAQQLEARFEIQTYVARTVVAPAAPKSAKPAADPGKPGERQ
jgi:type IV pilus assembly protein PilO